MQRQNLNKTISGLALSAALLVGFTGCDGGGAGEYSVVPEAPEISERGFYGNAQGLNGFLTLSWLGRSQAVGAGDFAIFPAFDSEDASETTFTLSISEDPLGQRCTIDSQTEFVNQVDDVTGISISCVDQNVVIVNVENFFSGEPLPDTPFTATWTEQGAPQAFAGVVNSEGQFELELEAFEGRIVVNTDIDGFGEQSAIVTNTAIAAAREARLLMQTQNLGSTFLAEDGVNLNVSGETLVTIPPNALVDENDTLYTGTVSAELTVVDPTVDVALMPGDYLSRDGSGLIRPMQSYGAISVTFTGAAGEVLDLAAGQSAPINIPVATAELSRTLPATVPLFSYDRLNGYWIQEETGTLQTLGSGMRVYSGTVSHFTTWNADVLYDPVNVNGCVVSPAGAPMANVRVDAVGQSYLGSSRAVTDAAGQFAIPVRATSQVLLSAGDGLQSQTLEVTSEAGDSTVAECLVASAGASTITLSWGENPRDLDTRFFGISPTDSALDFHLDYTQRSVTRNNIVLELDVDDTSGFGPEVTTIPDFPYAGTYRYGVHLFSGSGTIQSSPARVELNLAGDVTVFTPPSGTPTECWAVFDVDIDLAGFPTLRTLGTWEAESYCTAGNFNAPISTSSTDGSIAVAKPVNPLAEQIQQKYYAR